MPFCVKLPLILFPLTVKFKLDGCELGAAGIAVVAGDKIVPPEFPTKRPLPV
jgi:hypothetical protein